MNILYNRLFRFSFEHSIIFKYNIKTLPLNIWVKNDFTLKINAEVTCITCFLSQWYIDPVSAVSGWFELAARGARGGAAWSSQSRV